MNKNKKESHVDQCKCNKPEIRDSFEGNCSKEQILKCHGEEHSDESI